MELGWSLSSANTFGHSSPQFYPFVGPAGLVVEMVEVEVEMVEVEVGMVAPAGMVAVVGMVVAAVEMVVVAVGEMVEDKERIKRSVLSSTFNIHPNMIFQLGGNTRTFTYLHKCLFWPSCMVHIAVNIIPFLTPSCMQSCDPQLLDKLSMKRTRRRPTITSIAVRPLLGLCHIIGW